MDLLKILKKKSKQYEIDKREGDIADKQHQLKIEKQEEERNNLEKIKELSGYRALTDKLREELKSQGLKRGDIARKVSEQIGTFDPKKDYHVKEEPVKKSRMKTMKIDNSKAIIRKKKENLINETNDNLNIQIPKFIDNIISGIEEKIPKKTKNISKEKPKGRLMTTTKIVEPVKKKRGRPPIPQEIKEQKKLEKIQKANEEKERKKEEKEYAEREKNRQEYSKKYNAKQYIENKAELKKLKKYMREELETGGYDKQTKFKYNDLKRRIKEYEDKYINNVV